jgi:N4-gp56 family major capsid protein
MADQKSGDAALSAAVNTYFVKKVLKDFEPKVKFYESAPIKELIPKGGGSTVEFTRYRKIDPKTTDNTDEFTADQAYLSAVVITATLRERDEYVQLSRFADLTALGGPLEQAVDKVGNMAARSLDKMVRNDIGMAVADVANASSVNMNNLAIDGGTLNSTGITARVWSHDQAAAGDRFPMYHNKTRVTQSAQVVSFASSAMTMKTLNHAVNVLATKDVDPLSNGKFCLIAHPTVVYQLFTSTGFKGWHQHTTSSPAQTGPAGVRELDHTIIKQTTDAYAFPLSGDTLSTSSGTLYCSLLFGSEAYGVAEIGQAGFKLYIKKSGPTTVSDPTNMKRQVGYTVRGAAKVLNKSAGLWILSTEL